MTTSLEEYMGREYAESFPGLMYLSLEEMVLNASTSKGAVRRLGLILMEIYPLPLRERFGFELTAYGTKWIKDCPWQSMPDIPKGELESLKVNIMYTGKKAPQAVKKLIKLFEEDPKQFVWQSPDCYKILSMLHDIKGWNN
jgi:hypothetical protein